MSLNKKVGRILAICGTALFLTTPVLASGGNSGNSPDDETSLIAVGSHLLLAGKGHGPGDGTGNSGSGPKDGTGNGPGDCTTGVFAIDPNTLLARGGNGNGGHGPGDGTGNGGNGPADGTGNGPGTGTCTNS